MNLIDLVSYADRKGFDSICLGLSNEPILFGLDSEFLKPDFKFAQSNVEDIIAELIDEESYAILNETGSLDGLNNVGNHNSIYYKFYMIGGRINLFLHLIKLQLPEYVNIKEFYGHINNCIKVRQYTSIGCRDDNLSRLAVLGSIQALTNYYKKVIIIDFEKGRYLKNINNDNTNISFLEVEYDDDMGALAGLMNERYFHNSGLIIISDPIKLMGAPYEFMSKIKPFASNMVLITSGCSNMSQLSATTTQNYPQTKPDAIIYVLTIIIQNNRYALYSINDHSNTKLAANISIEKSLVAIYEKYKLELSEIKNAINNNNVDYNKFLEEI